MQVLIIYTTDDGATHTKRINVPDGIPIDSDEVLERVVLALPDEGDPEVVSYEEVDPATPTITVTCTVCGYTEQAPAVEFIRHEQSQGSIWECARCDNPYMERVT